MSTVVTPETVSETKADPAGSGFADLSMLLMAVAVGLVAFGFYRMFAYTSGDKIVGGDAYNFTILALRGVGFIAAGGAAAMLAATMAVLALWHQGKAKR